MSDQTPEHATSDYVVLCAEDIERLIPFGCVRETRAAQPLFEAGDESTAFFVVLGGTVDILSANPSGPKLITTHVAGQFLGELNLLIGQRPFVSAVVAEPGSVLAIDLTVFRDIMRTMPDLSDIVFKEFVARRTHTIEGSGERDPDHRDSFFVASDGFASFRLEIAGASHVDRPRRT